METYLHTYMKLMHADVQNPDTPFGGRKNGGHCEIFHYCARETVADLLQKLSNMTVRELEEARAHLREQRKHEKNTRYYTAGPKKRPAVADDIARVIPSPKAFPKKKPAVAAVFRKPSKWGQC